jgi:hypothetical protein
VSRTRVVGTYRGKLGGLLHIKAKLFLHTLYLTIRNRVKDMTFLLFSRNCEICL